MVKPRRRSKSAGRTNGASDFLDRAAEGFIALATRSALRRRESPPECIEARARTLVRTLVFLRFLELRGFHAESVDQPACTSPDDIIALDREARRSLGPLLEPPPTDEPAGTEQPTSLESLFDDGEAATDLLDLLRSNDDSIAAAAATPTTLGRLHERMLHASPLSAAGGSVRRSRGIYYTPECAARSVAREAIDVLRRAHAAGPWRILDPACGGGAFLTAAVHELAASAPDSTAQRQSASAAASACNDGPAGRVAALAQCHGFDLDPEAVATARLALFLELPDATGSSANRFDAAWIPTAVALLQRNIRHGDFLSDAFESPDGGGFDLILGNPPYRRELNAKSLLDSVAATRLGRRYRASRMDLSYYFMHRGIEWLRPGGVLSFLVGAYWTAGRSAARLIEHFRETCRLDDVLLLGRAPVFEGVSGRHLIFRAVKGGEGPTTIRRVPDDAASDPAAVFAGNVPLEVHVKTAEQVYRFGRLDLSPPFEELGRRVSVVPLGRLGLVRQGIVENPAVVTRKARDDHGGPWTIGAGVFTLTDEELRTLNLPDEELSLLRPYHDLCDLGRYFAAERPSRRLIYATSRTWPDATQFPTLLAHLAQFRPILEARRETRIGIRPWWQLHWPRDEAVWQSPKIAVLQMAARPSFACLRAPAYVPFSVNVFVPHEPVRPLLTCHAAILNSRLARSWFQHHAKQRGAGPEINGHLLAQFPMRAFDLSQPADRETCETLGRLAGEAAERTRAQRESMGRERTVCENAGRESTDGRQERLEAVEAAIDRLVDRIYEEE